MKKILAIEMLVASPLAAQDRSQTTMSVDRSAMSGETHAAITGEIAVVNTFTNQVTVNTTEIPGMKGKQTAVAFVVKDSAQLKNYKAGDKVTGELVTKGNDSYLENVKVSRKGSG